MFHFIHYTKVAILIVFSLSLVSVGISSEGTYVPHKLCTSSSCDDNHECTACQPRSDGCTNRCMLHASPCTECRPGINPQQCCYDSCTHICGYGGCELQPGMEQVGKAEPCVNATARCFYTCMKETCCPSQCCTKLACTLLPMECQVPQQKYLDPGDTDKSEIYYAGLSDGSTMPFPFFTTSKVAAGGSCEAMRAWGRCRCTNGKLEPGCDPHDSSSWFTLDAAGRLPANLSLTCVAPAGGGGGGGSSGGGGGGQGQGDPGQFPDSKRTGLSSGQIAGIVVGSTVGVLALMGLAGYAGYLGSNSQRWMQTRVGASYQPVFTGQSYSPELEVRGGGGFISRMRGLFTPRSYYGSSSRGAAGTWGLGALAAGSTVHSGDGLSWDGEEGEEGAGLDAPAMPEEDLFTLEDLEDVEEGGHHDGSHYHRSSKHRHHYGGSRYHRDKEVELGSVHGGVPRHQHKPHRTSRQHTGDSAMSQPQEGTATPVSGHGRSKKAAAGGTGSASKPLLQPDTPGGSPGGEGADITTYPVSLSPGASLPITPTHTGGRPVRPPSSGQD